MRVARDWTQWEVVTRATDWIRRRRRDIKIQPIYVGYLERGWGASTDTVRLQSWPSRGAPGGCQCLSALVGDIEPRVEQRPEASHKWNALWRWLPDDQPMWSSVAYTMGFTTEIAMAVTVAIASVEHHRWCWPRGTLCNGPAMWGISPLNRTKEDAHGP